MNNKENSNLSNNNYSNNDKNVLNKRKKIKFGLQIASISTAVAALGVGTYFISTSFIDEKAKILPQGKPESISFLIPNTNHKILINEYKAVYNKNDEQRYYLTKINENGSVDKSALELLGKIIVENLSYGPEITELKSINIGYQQLNILEANGFYIGLTQEMFIDPGSVIEKFENLGYSVDPQADNINNNVLSTEQKIQAIFPTIFHEYGHHIANSYISSLKVDDPNTQKLFFQEISDSEVVLKSSLELYDKNFYNEFIKYLNYEDNEINNNLLYKNTSNNIGSFESAASLFKIANSEQRIGSKDIFENSNKQFLGKLTANNGDNFEFRSLDDTFLAYYYSFSELITRKFQQISYSPLVNINDKNQFNNDISNAIQFYGTAAKNNTVGINAFGEDILHNFSIDQKKDENNNKIYSLKNLYLTDHPYGGAFYSENEIVQIKNNSIKLYESYLKSIGYGKSISQLHSENTYKAISESIGAIGEEDIDSVKIQGYFDDEKNIKGIVFEKKDSTEKIIEEIDIVKSEDFAFKAKSTLFSSRDITPKDTDAFKNALYSSYSTKNYVNLTKYNLNTELMFWNDINDDGKATSNEYEKMNNLPEKTVTNFKSHNISSINVDKTFYQVNEDFTISKDY